MLGLRHTSHSRVEVLVVGLLVVLESVQTRVDEVRVFVVVL